MNALPISFAGLQPLVDAPLCVVLPLKITVILSAAWLAHLALARFNPRWRVCLWRVTAAGMIVLPALAWLLPAVKIHVQQPPPVETAASATASAADPRQVGRPLLVKLTADDRVAGQLAVGSRGTCIHPATAFRFWSAAGKLHLLAATFLTQ